MKKIHSFSFRKARITGFTLVELMVGMAIGLLVVLVATQFMLSNRATSSTQNNASRMEEGARFAFDMMARQIRIAGFFEMRPPPFALSTSKTKLDFVTLSAEQPSAEKAFPSEAGTSCAAGAPALNHMICGANDDGINGSDELQIRYFGHSTPISTQSANVADGGIVTCTGRAVSGSDMVEERYYIRNIWNAAQNRNVPTLVCTAFVGEAAIQAAAAPPTNVAMDNNTVALVDNVERMQILYGYDLDPADTTRAVGRWSPASPTGAPNNMGQVLAVRVSLLVSAETLAMSGPKDTATYRFFGQDYAAAGDSNAIWVDPGATLAATSPYGIAERHRMRKLFSFTSTLRNRL